jgi:YggT family protein
MGILWLAIKTIGSLFVMACALRAYLQLLRLPAQNPLSRLTFQMTDWIVLPLRRVFPGFGGFDWASFLAALLLSLALSTVFYFFMTLGFITELAVEKPVRPFGWLVVLALLWAMSWFVQLCVVILIVSVLMSWLSPVHPLKPVIDLLVSPFLLPFRRLLGGVRRSGFDLSPIGGFLMLQITAAVLSEFESSVMRHLF